MRIFRLICVLLFCFCALYVIGGSIDAFQKKGQTVLKVSWPSRDARKSKSFDLDSVEEMGLTNLTGQDPHFNKQLNYSGILVSKLISSISDSDKIERLRFYAADDYQVEIPVDLLKRYPVLLATRIEGKRWNEGDVWLFGPDRINLGPLYLVFPNIDYKDEKDLSYVGNWIFSVKSIDLLQSGEGLAKVTTSHPADERARQGMELFVKHCSHCHQIFSQGGKKGPALDKIAASRSADYLKRYIIDPQAVVPAATMPRVSEWGPNFGEQEADAIVAYLEYLGAGKKKD